MVAKEQFIFYPQSHLLATSIILDNFDWVNDT